MNEMKERYNDNVTFNFEERKENLTKFYQVFIK